MNISRTIAAALAVAALSAPVAVGAQTQQERDDVRERRSQVEESLDVLTATDAEIDAALDDIDATIARQQRAVADAEKAAAAAAAAERNAAGDLRRAEHDVAVLEQAIADMAVASYMHPPTADLLQGLQAASLSDAVVQRIYLDARANRDFDLLDLLEEAEAVAAERTESLALAADQARLAVEEATAALGGLQQEQQRHVRMATDLQDRIDASLAEAAVLADLDAELSEKIRAEQAALIERLPEPEPPPVVARPEPVVRQAPVPVPRPTTTFPPVVEAVADDPPVTAPPVTAPPVTAPPVTAPPVQRPPVTTPPVSAPPRSVDTPPLRTVWGFTVHADIADQVDAMFTAAAADGVRFGGSGYRSTERQIQLRIANCGPTQYDIWIRRASTCSPPTAVPGRSLHEQGRALDLTFAGRLITSRSDDGFVWLAANASQYGLRNLPSEPWHWSTTGG